MTLEKIVDIQTGEEIIREYTAEEVKAAEAHLRFVEERKQREQAKETARLAVLAKLGLTEEEAKALLG